MYELGPRIFLIRIYVPTTMPKAPKVSDFGFVQKRGGWSIPMGTTMVLEAWL